MAELTERTLGYGFGLVGGALVVVGALAALVLGVLDLFSGRPLGTIHTGTEVALLLGVGGFALVVAYLGQHAWRNRGVTSGTLLLFLALLAGGGLGFGSNVVVLIGAVFVFLGGVLFLMEPAKYVVRRVTAPV